MSVGIREVEHRDHILLAEHLSRGFPVIPASRWMGQFDMWWAENPAMGVGFAPGWVLETGDGEIVGFLGNIPVRYRIGGKERLAAASTAWYVRQDFRGIHSLRLLLEFMSQPGISLFIFATPSEAVVNLLEKKGFVKAELPYNGQEYWYILNFNRIYQSYLGKSGSQVTYPRLHRSLLPPLDRTLSALHGLKERHVRLRGRQYTCSIPESCDMGFTRLWEENRPEIATTLVRDAANLNWLCFSRALKNRRYLIDARNGKGELAGYLVFDLENLNSGGTRILQLKDAWLPHTGKALFESLFAKSVDLAREKGASALKFWPFTPEMDDILKRLFRVRRQRRYRYYYRFRSEYGKGMEEEPASVYLPSLIDPDRGLA